MATSILLLGSNQGDRMQVLAQARQHLQDHAGTITRESAIYETAAWGLEDQPAFLNQALLLNTALEPEALLAEINAIEARLGRVRKIKWAARLIDIDILYYDHQVVNTPRLRIPHPELQNRRFALMPLAEIAPDWQHPVFGLSNSALLAACPDALAVKKLPHR